MTFSNSEKLHQSIGRLIEEFFADPANHSYEAIGVLSSMLSDVIEGTKKEE